MVGGVPQSRGTEKIPRNLIQVMLAKGNQGTPCESFLSSLVIQLLLDFII